MDPSPNRLFRREALWMLLVPIAVIAVALIGGCIAQLLLQRG